MLHRAGTDGLAYNTVATEAVLVYSTRIMDVRTEILIDDVRKGIRPWPLLLLVTVLALEAQTSTGQAGTLQTGAPDLKLFEAATSLANTLTSWALVMIGGSLLAIVGTSYYRPAALWVRCAYFAFVPGWFFLAWSIYAGSRVQRVYMAALYSVHPKLDRLIGALNKDALAQIERMEIGLAFFGIWLMMYLFWWIFNNEAKKESFK